MANWKVAFLMSKHVIVVTKLHIMLKIAKLSEASTTSGVAWATG